MFGLFGGWKMIGMAAAGLAIVAVVGAGALHYRNLLAAKEAAIVELNAERIARAEAEQGLDMYKEHTEILSRALVENSKNTIKAQKPKDDIIAKLQKHDLPALARSKPGLVAAAINRGVADINRMFEETTAADPGDGGSAAADRPAEAEAN